MCVHGCLWMCTHTCARSCVDVHTDLFAVYVHVYSNLKYSMPVVYNLVVW